MNVFVNAPPQNGFCGVTPTAGIALETEFKVSCDKWSDDDRPIQFSFGHAPSRSLSGIVFPEDTLNPTASLSLPASAAFVFVIVKDGLGDVSDPIFLPVNVQSCLLCPHCTGHPRAASERFKCLWTPFESSCSRASS